MNRIKRALIICLSLLSVISLFPKYHVYAEADSNPKVLYGIESGLLLSVSDTVLDDFNSAKPDWSAEGGECRTDSTEEFSYCPPYEGSGSLTVSAESYDPEVGISLEKDLPEGYFSADYRYIALSVFVPKGIDSALFTLKLICKDGTVSDSKPVSAGAWQTVLFDMRKVDKGQIESVEIDCSLIFKSEPEGGGFCIDTLVGLKDETDAFALRYLTPSYNAVNCTVTSDPFTVTLSDASEQYIEAIDPSFKNFGGNKGIRIDYVNRSTCRSLTLKIKSLGSDTYDHKITLPITATGNKSTCVFPISSSYVGAYAIVFDGGIGEIEIASVSVSDCYCPVQPAGTVSECRITADKLRISIKGTVENAVSDDGFVYLYSLPLWENASDIDFEDRPLTETSLNGNGFSFAIPLSENKDELYRKFALVIYENGRLTPISEAVSVNNPEILASERTYLPTGKKGSFGLSDNYLLDGISQTVIDVRADKLMTYSVSDGEIYEYGGNRYRFSKSYLEYLDSQMLKCRDGGIAVRFMLRTECPYDLALQDILCHPSYLGEGYAAFNTQNDEGIGAIRAITSLLVTRYGTDDGVTDNLVGIIVGSDVNDHGNGYNMGDTDIFALTVNYASAIRTVYNTARSITASFDVSAHFGGAWYSETAYGDGFNARTAIEYLSSYIKAGSDIGYSISYDATPERGKYAYETEAPYIGADAQYINAANISALTDFLSSQTFAYNGVGRSILLIGDEQREAESSEELMKMSADYLFTYLTVSSKNMKAISAYVPPYSADHNDTFRLADTDAVSEIKGYASELIGKERLDALFLNAGLSRHYSFGSSISSLPSDIKGESVIFDFSSGSSGWGPSLGCLSSEGGVTYKGKNGWLRARMTSVGESAYRGVGVSLEKPMDLSVAPFISFDIRCSSLPETVKELELTVLVYSAESLCHTEVEISALSEQTVICDLSSFKNLSSCDRMAIYVRGKNGEELGEPMLLISSVKAHSKTMSSDDLGLAIMTNKSGRGTVSPYTVAVLSVIAVSASAIELYRLIRKRNTRDENE